MLKASIVYPLQVNCTYNNEIKLYKQPTSLTALSVKRPFQRLRLIQQNLKQFITVKVDFEPLFSRSSGVRNFYSVLFFSLKVPRKEHVTFY